MNHVEHRAKIHARCAMNQKNFARHSQTVLRKTCASLASDAQVTRKTFLEGIKIFCVLRDRSKHRDNCTVTEWPPIGKIAAHSAYDMFHGMSA